MLADYANSVEEGECSHSDVDTAESCSKDVKSKDTNGYYS